MSIPRDLVESPYTAVVFAYHDVGVRCLAVMLAHGVKVQLVVTHRDDPSENDCPAPKVRGASHRHESPHPARAGMPQTAEIRAK